MKDQIGSFFYFPSINFRKGGGGFGPIRVNNRQVIPVPFPKLEADFDLLIGEWYSTSYKVISLHHLHGWEFLPRIYIFSGLNLINIKSLAILADMHLYMFNINGPIWHIKCDRMTGPS